MKLVRVLSAFHRSDTRVELQCAHLVSRYTCFAPYSYDSLQQADTITILPALRPKVTAHLPQHRSQRPFCESTFTCPVGSLPYDPQARRPCLGGRPKDHRRRTQRPIVAERDRGREAVHRRWTINSWRSSAFGAIVTACQTQTPLRPHMVLPYRLDDSVFVARGRSLKVAAM